MTATEPEWHLPEPAIPLVEKEKLPIAGVAEAQAASLDGRLNSNVSSAGSYGVEPRSPRMVTFKPSPSSPGRPRDPPPSHDAPPQDTKEKPKTKKRRTGIYLYSPIAMVGAFLFGVAMAVSHHFYYHSLNGDVVGNMDDQQRALRYGTTFAYLTQVSLVMSVGIAYTQWFYKTLRALREKSEREPAVTDYSNSQSEKKRMKEEEEKGVSVAAIDAGMAADQTILALMNLEFLQKVKIGALIAVIAWLLQLPGLVTPATLSVAPGLSSNDSFALVPSLNIKNVNISGYYQPRRFAYWVDEYGSQDPNIKPYLFLGPRTIISRLSAATATSGRILPIVPPFVNSTYDIQFYGPKVSCSEANSTISTIVDKFVASEMSSSQLAAQRVSNAYFAFVPDLSAIRDGATIESNGGDIPQPVFSNRMQGPSNGSNEIWMTFKRYANGSNCDTMSAGIPPSLESHYLVCRLHNASYHVNLAFTEGNQTITDIGTELREEIPFPRVDPRVSSDLIQHAYSGIMWAFTDPLTGTMSFYTVNSTETGSPSNFSEITTSIQLTSLLGSSDLHVFFDLNHGIVAGINCTSSDQRVQDINLARNRTLDVLIEELSFNTTVSFMTNTLLSPFINTTVRMDTTVNLYEYHPQNLLLAYGLAIFSTLIVNILGGIAFKANGVSYDRLFSSILSATRDPTLKDLFPTRKLGKLPVPDSVKRTFLVFGKMNKGVPNVFGKEEESGWGFMQVKGEVKQRRGSKFMSI